MRQHDELFEAYVAALREAKQSAETWWDELLDEQSKAAEDSRSAEETVRKRWPFGPASHPWVIAVFREYYLRCEELNNEAEAAALEDAGGPSSEGNWGSEGEHTQTTIPPRVLVIEQLANDETEDLYDFVLNVRFVPIGQKGQRLC